MRAVIGMCGAMTALKDNGILDSAMYKAGVSGSAWYVNNTVESSDTQTLFHMHRYNFLTKQKRFDFKSQFIMISLYKHL